MLVSSLVPVGVLISLFYKADASILEDGKGLFSYNPDADNGPEFWALLDTSPDENMCAGNRNSPVGLSVMSPEDCIKTEAGYTFEVNTYDPTSFPVPFEAKTDA
jgi:hypothetical protein